jgi:hypothetical protein
VIWGAQTITTLDGGDRTPHVLPDHNQEADDSEGSTYPMIQRCPIDDDCSRNEPDSKQHHATPNEDALTVHWATLAAS